MMDKYIIDTNKYESITDTATNKCNIKELLNQQGRN